MSAALPSSSCSVIHPSGYTSRQMAKFDIELLIIFEEIYKTGSTTRTAENLGLAQPTVSIALNKLRNYFADVLFSRTSKGMEPTPHAESMINEVRAVTTAMRNVMQRKSVFDPSESSRTFKICMTDVSEVVLLPKLLNYLKQKAPLIRVDVSKITLTTQKQLEDGEIDVAVGFLPNLEAGFYQQKLFEHHFVCVVASKHPRIGAVMTRQDFLDEGHVLVKGSTVGHAIVEKALFQNDLQRKVVLRIPSYMSAASILASTDCIATVPERFATLMVKKEEIRMLLPPVKLPELSIKQHWHERFHSEPGNKWLRQEIARLFLA
jgi:DNA-binding transcriptional LysR family regulator